MTISTGLVAGVLQCLEGTEDLWDATLDVDVEHPFFFDHPLDHVPAVLLVEGIRELAERAAGGPGTGAVVGLELAMGRFCEFDPATRIEVTRAAEGAGRWMIAATQADRVVAAGTAITAPVPAAGVTAGADADRAADSSGDDLTELVTATLAHRHRPENVLVSGVRSLGADRYRGALAPLAPDHYFARLSPGLLSLTEVLEAARQLATVVMHLQGVPQGHQFVVTGLTATLDRPLPRGTAVAFEGTAPPLAGSTIYEGGCAVLADGVEAGRIRFAGRIMPRRVYDRLRDAALRAGGAR